MSDSHLSGVRLVTIPPKVIENTMRALRVFGAERLEGLVLWLGKIESNTAHVLTAFVPDQKAVSSETGIGYFVNGKTLFDLNRALAETGLRLIAQVHSHPTEAYHSDTDDHFAIVTANGGLSLVVPDFGQAPPVLANWAVYRLFDGIWVELSSEEVRELFEVDYR